MAPVLVHVPMPIHKLVPMAPRALVPMPPRALLVRDKGRILLLDVRLTALELFEATRLFGGSHRLLGIEPLLYALSGRDRGR